MLCGIGKAGGSVVIVGRNGVDVSVSEIKDGVGVYIIINNLNGKCYVGSSRSMMVRM